MRFGGLVALLAAIGLSTGCRYQNMLATGSNGAQAPYTNLTCGSDGDEGFSFEVPSCVCNSGIRLSYVAKNNDAGGIDFLYIYESGIFRENGPFARAESHSIDGVERLFIEGEELPPRDECTATQKTFWDGYSDSFTEMWDHYNGPVFDEMFMTCIEDMIDEDIDRRIEALNK